jgi:hypothetical protein
MNLRILIKDGESAYQAYEYLLQKKKRSALTLSDDEVKAEEYETIVKDDPLDNTSIKYRRKEGKIR